MMLYRALIDGNVIANRIKISNKFFKRMIGLLFKKKIEYNEGLLIYPCKQVHTFWMNFDIDVLFLSKTGEILHIEKSMLPGNVSKYIRNCHQVLELKGGTAVKKGIIEGKRVAFDIVE